MSRKGIPNGTHAARRIGTIGYEIGTDHAARRCAEYARLMGAVVVAVDDQFACWAMLPGSKEATLVFAAEADSVVGTYAFDAKRSATRLAIADDIRCRMEQLGGARLAA